MATTHCDRVLGLLSDGRPHSHHELYDLHVIAHSRISDLRRKGHAIEMWRDGDLYLYQLVPSVPTRDVTASSPRAEGATPATQLTLLDRDLWPSHQPECHDAPIPGRVWYSGCDDSYPRVNPDGVCEGCGKQACAVCGKEDCDDHQEVAA